VQLKAPAESFQSCLAHQLKDLQQLIELCPGLVWAVQMQKLFRSAIHLWNQFENLTLDGFVRQAMLMEKRLDQLLEKQLIGKDARRLQRRFIKHRNRLLIFLHYPGVEPTNNARERALRPSVIYRKVTSDFRSEWGVHTYAAFRTIGSTARQRGERFFDELVKLFGPTFSFPVPIQSPWVITIIFGTTFETASARCCCFRALRNYLVV
jgi:transposase